MNVTGVALRSRVPAHPRLLSEEQIREAHRRYAGGRSLRAVAAEFGISHVQLAAAFHRLRLEVRGNRTTDPLVVQQVVQLRDVALHTWPEIARIVGLSLRQVQNIYSNATRED